MFLKIFSYITLISYIFSHTLGVFAFQEDAFVQHSLGELPYGNVENIDLSKEFDSETEIRRDILSASEEGVFSHVGTNEDRASKNIHFDAESMGEDHFITLLAEKRIFENTQAPLSTGFLVNPFTSQQGNEGGLLELFLSSGSIENSYEVDLMEESLFLPPEKATTIRVHKNAKQKKHIPGLKGALSYEISSGTLITTLSGDIIDTSKIGLEKIEDTKKQKAKLQYEKKMKNRGNMKKGRADAQVEGFEFGLSGTHLIFSRPVKLSIDMPNMSDGNSIDLLTFHAGDSDFHTGGLSVDPMTDCNPDGTASIPGAKVHVKNGKVTFYTCGASSFTMNPSGGTTGSNDLRAVIGDCAQIQLYYNNLTQIYTGNPPATGCTGAPSVWPVLRIGGTTYGNTFTAWTSATTTGTTLGNLYTATSTMRATVGGLNYDLIIDWSHTAPNKYLTWSWRVILPAGNTQNVRFYYGMDSYVAGADANDVGYLTSTGGQTVGVFDNAANVLSAFRYLSGQTWTAYQANGYNTVRTQIVNGVDFTNNIQNTAGDLGFGVNWNFGTGANITYSGAVEWRLAPYVAASVPDLIPGIAQPEGPLTTNLLSEMPITVTNVGNASSSGLHTVILTIPTNITGPASSFTNNGWSCGAQVGTGVTCTKTTNISAPIGEDTVRIPVIPMTAASGSSVTFFVSISNPGDSNITNNTAFAINAVVGGMPASDPGGVTGERLWLRANTGTNCTVTGCTITNWINQGALGAAANAVTGLGTATYDPINRINGNPTIYLNGASFNTNNTLGLPTRANSIFAVTRIGTGGQFLMGTQTVTTNARSWTTRPTTDTWMRNASTVYYNGANSRSVNTPAITSTIRQTAGASAGYTNGRSVLTSADTTTFTVNNFGIGRVGNTNSTLTNLAEVIIYNAPITPAQQKQVESYLAVKYGITLDQITATNYVYSNGSVVWNAATAGVYNKNIAGIGRDDSSTLNQLQSQSVTNTADIIVSKSFITNNRHALLWGNDAAQTTTWTGTDAPFGFNRIGREWQFQEKNGDLGIVTLSYPVSSVPAGFSGTLMLFADADGLFTTGATVYTGTLNGSNWNFSINIADMQYITFAKTVPTDLTPPIISGVNIASGTLIPSSNFTIIANFSDTGSAINPGSFSGRIYAWDSTGSTWNLTNIAPSYMSITGTTTASTGQLRVSGIPFGKYRFDLVIADTFGNTLIQSYTYFIDAVEWTVSAPLYPIGVAPLGSDTFGSGELIITIQTVGAGFDLSMIRTTDLTYLTEVISVYDGANGWGYDKNIGSGYSSTITAHGSSQNIVSIAKNINLNGQRNTFTYRVKYGMNTSSNTSPGDYLGNIQFVINLTY